MHKQRELTDQLRKIVEETEVKAKEIGLDFFTTVFELVDYKKLHEVAAYGGLPTRYPHWRWGMEYDKLMKSYEYGLATIYEMVINNDPCYAYLLDSNNLSTQKTVIAHVFGHSDFFKNNLWFKRTNRKMLDQAANHSSIVREIIEEVSYEEVESFIDTCLSFENLLDTSLLFDYPKESEPMQKENFSGSIASKNYLEKFINDNSGSFFEKNKGKDKDKELKEKAPISEEQDILRFLSSYADIPAWKAKIIEIIRSEAYYFLPQRYTKILNEGWATYWHSKMMTELHPLDVSEIIDYCCQYASIVEAKGNQINPYRLGLELLKYIDRKWEKKSGNGKEKIFEIRKIHSDLSFIDNYLDEEFCHESKMFLYNYDPNTMTYTPSEKDFKSVKNEILTALTNCGWPIIKIIDNNYKNRGELLLRHYFDGSTLDQNKTLETLKKMQSVWNKPVHIETKDEKSQKRLSYDGRETSIKKF